MSRWHSLYETPELFSPEWGHHRIFAPVAYPACRNATTVAISMLEALVVARNFPVCWQRVDDRLQLVALVALREGFLRFPPYPELPLALRAYPFIIPDEVGDHLRAIEIDRAIPDQPTDIGAPILLDDNRLSDGARMRIGAAVDLARAIGATDELTKDLETHGLLEAWPLKFDLGEAGKVDRQDLFVFSAAQLNSTALFRVVERHGAQAGIFLALQRTSLFRINWLLNALREDYAKRSRPAPAEREINL